MPVGNHVSRSGASVAIIPSAEANASVEKDHGRRRSDVRPVLHEASLGANPLRPAW